MLAFLFHPSSLILPTNIIPFNPSLSTFRLFISVLFKDFVLFWFIWVIGDIYFRRHLHFRQI